jgi:hypothetical protein
LRFAAALGTVALTAPLVVAATPEGAGADAATGADALTGAEGAEAVPVVGAEVADGAPGAGVAPVAPVGGVLDPEVGGVAGVPKVFDVQAHAKLTPTMTVLSTDMVPITRTLIRPLISHLPPASLTLNALRHYHTVRRESKAPSQATAAFRVDDLL